MSTSTATRWTARPRPWHDQEWLRQHRQQGLTYQQMADLAGCNLCTIRTAMKKAGLGGGQPVKRDRPPRARTAGLPPRPADNGPVCDPNLCPGWETCLDDVDEPCCWPG